jgi:hypothetical protein
VNTLAAILIALHGAIHLSGLFNACRLAVIRGLMLPLSRKKDAFRLQVTDIAYNTRATKPVKVRSNMQ